MSECDATREHLLDSIRGRLGATLQTRLEAHLKNCAECSRIFERERALDRAIAGRPRHALPDSLRSKLSAQVIPAKKAWPRWGQECSVSRRQS